MILRRVIEHVKQQQWTAIGIDLLIVILGVFIGTQVSNWNASRHEAARAQSYLKRIEADLRTDLQTIERRRAFWTRVNGYGQAAIHYAESGERVQGSAWKTVLAFYQASQLWTFVPSDTTFQELRSGGEMSLIQDERLRARLSQYYAETNGANVGFILAYQPEYRRSVRGLTPSVAANHIWSKCWTQPNENEQHLLDCESPMTEAEAQAVLDAYLKDPELLAELRFWIANQGVALSVIGNTHAAASRMLAAIDAVHGANP